MSVGIDVGLAARDIHTELNSGNEKETEREMEIQKLIEIDNELRDLLQESPLYGDIDPSSFFHEDGKGIEDDIGKIHIKCGDMINSIQVEYRKGGKGDLHGGPGGELKTFTVEEDERITAVRVSTLEGKGVSSISLCTDTGGREEVFGTVRENEEEHEMVDGAYVSAIKGCYLFENYEALPAIGFYGKYIDAASAS